ncbi:MAG: flagellar basal body P-ring protein FlgI [Alphaproteobacteria bacterium]|nr:flagellar basal body P-ring protein FlgI [Alphaproteobacteria bacterium]
MRVWRNLRHPLRWAIKLVLLIAMAAATSPADAASRIKDIADFEGIRENLLVGYGLVVGLQGTGDSLGNSAFTQQSLIGMLERLGVNTRGVTLNTKNIAAVMVTGNLPAFARHRTRVDVTVSALGDSKSLLGGTLLVTPMLGADGEVYAVAQGQVAVGGFSAEGASGSQVTKAVPTSARIPSGAIVEREVGFELASMDVVNITLRNPDLTTSRRVAQAVNAFIGSPIARAMDPVTIKLQVPGGFAGNVASLLTDIEQLRITTDQVARVIIDERTGTIVMGENVRIDTVAIAQGNLTIRITETPQMSQPGAFAPEGAETVVVARTDIKIEDGEAKKLAILQGGVSLQELVSGLNALGIGPRDMISILQAIKAAGALQAEIQVM